MSIINRERWYWCNFCASPAIKYSCCGMNSCSPAKGCDDPIENIEFKAFCSAIENDTWPKEIKPSNPEELAEQARKDIFG